MRYGSAAPLRAGNENPLISLAEAGDDALKVYAPPLDSRIRESQHRIRDAYLSGPAFVSYPDLCMPYCIPGGVKAEATRTASKSATNVDSIGLDTRRAHGKVVSSLAVIVRVNGGNKPVRLVEFIASPQGPSNLVGFVVVEHHADVQCSASIEHAHFRRLSGWGSFVRRILRKSGGNGG